MTRRPRPQTRDVKVTREQFDLAVHRTADAAEVIRAREERAHDAR